MQHDHNEDESNLSNNEGTEEGSFKVSLLHSISEL